MDILRCKTPELVRKEIWTHILAYKRPSARTRQRWEALWPPFEFKESSSATESLAWTNWPLFTVGLVQRGHSDETIRQVLGENMLRVWSAQLPPT